MGIERGVEKEREIEGERQERGREIFSGRSGVDRTRLARLIYTK